MINHLDRFLRQVYVTKIVDAFFFVSTEATIKVL